MMCILVAVSVKNKYNHCKQKEAHIKSDDHYIIDSELQKEALWRSQWQQKPSSSAPTFTEELFS